MPSGDPFLGPILSHLLELTTQEGMCLKLYQTFLLSLIHDPLSDQKLRAGHQGMWGIKKERGHWHGKL